MSMHPDSSEHSTDWTVETCAETEVVNHELAALRCTLKNLHSALSLAAFRLEQAGLSHEDLQAPLEEGAQALALESSGSVPVITVGPFVFGTPTQTGPFPPALRFVFDCGTNRLAKLEYAAGAQRWQNAPPAQWDLFLAWLLEENEDMIDHPENWGLRQSECLQACA